MKPIRLSAAVALIVAAACLAFRPALAADAVFPPGARVGLTPLVGLVPAKTFAGFETEDHGVKVLVTELPAAAYGEVANAFKSNPGGTAAIKPETIETPVGVAYYTTENAKDGATNVRRYSMILPGPTFSGYVAVQVPENASQDLHRRGRAADVCFRRDPQGSPGRRATRAVAVQDHRPRRFQECAHAGAGLPPSCSPMPRRPSSSNSALTW